MRKPRDYDAELKALDDKVRQLRSRRIVQLGELVIACGADALPIEVLAGALLDAAESKDAAGKEAAGKEAWWTKGAAFFRKPRAAAKSGAGDGGRASASDGEATPA